VDKVLFVGPLDRVLLLRTLPMLEGLGPVQLAAIAQHAEERHFARDSVLRLGNGDTEAIHVVMDGELSALGPDQREHRLQRGDAVGFVEMLSGSHETIVCRANVDTTTLALDWDAQIDVCEEHFAVVMQYIRYIARQCTARLAQRPQQSNVPVPVIAEQRFHADMNLLERTLVLSRSKAFSSGCLDALAELAHHVTQEHWRAGESIWETGQTAGHFLLVAAGALRCTSEQTGTFLRHAGAPVGIHEALGREKRWHGATCEQDAVTIRIDVEPFMDILEDHFDLALDLLAVLAGELSRLEQAETA
jgi:CRP-like cAMP-binding protein